MEKVILYTLDNNFNKVYLKVPNPRGSELTSDRNLATIMTVTEAYLVLKYVQDEEENLSWEEL